MNGVSDDRRQALALLAAEWEGTSISADRWSALITGTAALSDDAFGRAVRHWINTSSWFPHSADLLKAARATGNDAPPVVVLSDMVDDVERALYAGESDEGTVAAVAAMLRRAGRDHRADALERKARRVFKGVGNG